MIHDTENGTLACKFRQRKYMYKVRRQIMMPVGIYLPISSTV